MTAVEINKQIGRWLEGLRQSDAADTLVDVGIHYGELGRRRALAEFLAATGRTPTTHATISWNVNPTDWSHIIDRWDASRLAEPFAFTNEAPLRLGVAPHTPKSVMPRMLHAPSVGSVFVDVGRAKNALRRRPWQWPLRIATLGMDAVATAVLHHEIEDRDMFPAQLLQLHRAEDEPAAVDVLLVVGPLRRAVERVVVNRGPVANGVIVFDVDHSWVHPRSAVQTLRTVTGAVVVALHPDSNVADVTSELIRGMSHAQPFDIALTTATDGHAMLIGERAGLDRADLPHIARRMVHEAVMVRSEVAMTADRRFGRDRPGDILPPQPPFLEGFEDGLLDISRGPFLHEGDEATVVADHHSVFEQQVHAHETEQRWLQASLAHPKRPGEAATLKSGLNHVAVFIGPLERGAAHAPEPFDDAALPWDEEDAEAFRLTVAFVPLYPEGKTQTKQLDLPRVGASRRIGFRWTVRQPGEDGNEPFTPLARILVLFRNRVLQTTVVNGSIGEPIRLTETVSLRPHLGHLDERRAFDVAFFTNHDNRNVPRVIRVSSRQVVFSKMDTFEGIIDPLSAILGATVNMLNTPAGLGDERVRALLIELAGKGRDLYAELGTLGELGEAKRIQVVSARTTSFLPVELAYERHAPHGDARICDGFMAGKTRCDDTCPAAEDRSVVCPYAFIGMGRVIERISYD